MSSCTWRGNRRGLPRRDATLHDERNNSAHHLRSRECTKDRPTKKNMNMKTVDRYAACQPPKREARSEKARRASEKARSKERTATEADTIDTSAFGQRVWEILVSGPNRRDGYRHKSCDDGQWSARRLLRDDATPSKSLEAHGNHSMHSFRSRLATVSVSGNSACSGNRMIALTDAHDCSHDNGHVRAPHTVSCTCHHGKPDLYGRSPVV